MDSVWLQRAREAYSSSTSYLDSNYRAKIEDDILHFQSKHHSASKFNKDSYKYRSKIFRPKTRSSVRNNEAAAASVFFTNYDNVCVEPRNPNDPMQQASADVMKELLNYRLTETIPWFATLIGAFQDSQVVGVVCSHQYWHYEEKEEIVFEPEINQLTGEQIFDDDGNPVMAKIKQSKVFKDEPCCDLIPIENIRFHPNADWRNPVATSPYFIELIPMYVMDVKARMEKADPKTGTPKWKQLTDGQIKASTDQQYDSTRNIREEKREDKTTIGNNDQLSDFDIVWIHRNFMRIDGDDYMYYTAGVEYMLTDPMPVEDVVSLKERPYVIGVSVIETHKNYPTSIVGLGESIQKEINEIANQRLDNVKLVLNKRWFVKRGSQTDIKSLVRNVAGSVTLMNDPHNDVQAQDFPDVTSSSYAEQDRLNLDYDELVGTFSSSSVSSNRKLNETVGGMQMLRGSVNALTEYLLMTFAESWVEPTIKHLIKLIRLHETDTVVLGIAAEKAQLWKRYGIDQVTDEMLNQNLHVSVSVGTAATDPMVKLERFLLGVQKVMELQQMAMQMGPNAPNITEIQKEIFGRLGYKDGSRFLPSLDQNEQFMQIIQQLQQQLQQMQQELDDKNADREAKLVETQMKEEGQTKRKAAELETNVFLAGMNKNFEGMLQ